MDFVKDRIRQALATAPERLNDFSHEPPPITPLEDFGGIFPYRQNLYIAFLCDSSTTKFYQTRPLCSQLWDTYFSPQP